MNELQIFNYEQNEIRTVMLENEPWWVAKDVCDILEHSNPRMAISGLDDDEKGVSKVYTLGGEQEMAVVSEAGLYSLIIRSNKPEAKKFKRWVTHEILPTIRKHGMYAKDELFDNPDILISALQELKAERESKKLLERKIELDRPKILFADAVEASVESILIRDLAKLLKKNGVDIGQQRLYEALRQRKYIEKHSTKPTQKAVELKVLELKEGVRFGKNRELIPAFTTKVTGKGQTYFMSKFLEWGNE